MMKNLVTERICHSNDSVSFQEKIITYAPCLITWPSKMCKPKKAGAKFPLKRTLTWINKNHGFLFLCASM